MNRFTGSFRNLLRRKPVEIVFIGDEMLIKQAYSDLIGGEYGGETLPETARRPIHIGKRPLMATFQQGYSSVLMRKVTARSPTSLVVVLYDINGDFDVPITFVDEVCTLDASVLWLTGVWKPGNGELDIQGKPKNGDPPIPNLEQKRKELRLRNDTLKLSLKKGARYARWSEADSNSLRVPLKELVEDKHSKSNYVRSFKKNSFTFTDAETGLEINDPLELSEDDFIIAVMGPTGAGKSTFIKNATGCDELRIGDDLESCTSEIHIIRITNGDSKIYIVDTPGFNDTNRTDLEIFKLISEWFRQRFTNQVYLAGLVYLHRISDNRMAGTTLKNLKIFEELCGKDCFHKITLATTMWDDVETEKVGELREKQLESDYFSMMLQRGAVLKRLGHSKESARNLLEAILRDAKELRPLSLQRELVAYQKDLPETKAGRQMYKKLDDVFHAHQEALSQLNRDIREEKSDQVRLILTKERQALNQELLDLITDMQYMQLGLPARITQLVKRLWSSMS